MRRQERPQTRNRACRRPRLSPPTPQNRSIAVGQLRPPRTVGSFPLFTPRRPLLQWQSDVLSSLAPQRVSCCGFPPDGAVHTSPSLRPQDIDIGEVSMSSQQREIPVSTAVRGRRQSTWAVGGRQASAMLSVCGRDRVASRRRGGVSYGYTAGTARIVDHKRTPRCSASAPAAPRPDPAARSAENAGFTGPTGPVPRRRVLSSRNMSKTSRVVCCLQSASSGSLQGQRWPTPWTARPGLA